MHGAQEARYNVRVMAMRIATSLFFFALVCTAAFWSVPAYAQLDFGTAITLKISPEYPEPQNSVRVTVESSLIDLETEMLTWYVDGAEVDSGIGMRSIDVVAGGFGTMKQVEVVVTEEGFERARTEAIIRPVTIDMLWEADSYTPPFFRGRALPSAGSNLHFEAIPYFQRSDGVRVPIDEIVFTWKRDGYVIQGVSGRGKNIVLIPGPSLFDTDTISVEAHTTDNTFFAVGTESVSSIEPHLALYEEHPLFGIMYHRAFQDQNVVPEEELSFVAIPYFASISGPTGGGLEYTWKVNGNSLENNPERPGAITIDARGSSGRALIELIMTHATNFFFRAEGAWSFAFTASTAGGLNNPFGQTPQI